MRVQFLFVLVKEQPCIVPLREKAKQSCIRVLKEGGFMFLQKAVTAS